MRLYDRTQFNRIVENNRCPHTSTIVMPSVPVALDLKNDKHGFHAQDDPHGGRTSCCRGLEWLRISQTRPGLPNVSGRPSVNPLNWTPLHTMSSAHGPTYFESICQIENASIWRTSTSVRQSILDRNIKGRMKRDGQF